MSSSDQSTSSDEMATGSELAQPEFTFKCPYQPSSDIMKIDEDGDLHLVVGEDRCLPQRTDPEASHTHGTSTTFIVDSRALSRSSRFFKRLLYGGFAESQRPVAGQQWTVRLPEDLPLPMTTILHIMHGDYRKVQEVLEGIVPESVPKSRVNNPNIHIIYEITVLTDKYDLTHIMYPWTPSTVSCLENSQGDYLSLDVSVIAKYLWVAWELGDVSSFKLRVDDQLREACLDDGCLVSEEGHPVFGTVLEPPNIVEFIKEERLGYICQYLYNLRRVMSSGLICTRRARTATQDELAKHSLWPIPEDEEYEGSLGNLLHALRSVFDKVALGGSAFQNVKDRRELLAGGRPHDIIHTANLPEEILSHLRGQAEKSGLVVMARDTPFRRNRKDKFENIEGEYEYLASQ